jgi:hypothetical protein
MGSVRAGLTLTLLLLAPAAAMADVCAQLRPDWASGTRISALAEAILLFATLPSLALLLVTATALRFRSQWGGLAVVVLWAMWSSAPAFLNGDVLRAARSEGCVGSPALFIAAVAAICVGTVLYTLPRATRL